MAEVGEAEAADASVAASAAVTENYTNQAADGNDYIELVLRRLKRRGHFNDYHKKSCELHLMLVLYYYIILYYFYIAVCICACCVINVLLVVDGIVLWLYLCLLCYNVDFRWYIILLLLVLYYI